MSLDSMQQTPAPAGKPSISERLKALVGEWGALLAVVWFGLFAIVLVGFALAIQLGFETQSTAGTLGTWGAAYVATQLTKPLRFAATVVITPALGAFLRRFRRPQAPEAGARPAPEEAPEEAPGVRAPLDESASER
jgi:hypothetical protein